MTPEQIAQLEADRRKREEELLLLLLLLSGYIVRERAASEDAIRTILFAFGVNLIAESMADMHLDAFRLYAATLPDRDELIRQYTATAREAAEAMAVTMSQGVADAGGDVAEGLRLAGYSLSDANGIELGAERNLVLASNAGLFMGAAALFGIGAVTGLRHVSVLDDATTEICNERAFLQLRVDDPYWLSNFPSLHWNCRSIIVPLTGRFAVSGTLPTIPPLPGFGRMPDFVRAMIRQVGRAA